MTLILSMITPEYAIQASDRRVSTLEGEALVAVDDERNKAILLAERLAFAMTGPADIEGDTIEAFASWTGMALSSGLSVDEALKRTGTMFAHQLAQRDLGGHASLSFVGVGWTDVPSAPREPRLMWLSNTMSSGGSQTARPAGHFTMGHLGLASHEPFALLIAGAGMPSWQENQLKLDLFGTVSSTDQPAAAAEVLLKHIRAVAGLNPLVGEGVMINCLPYACGSPDGSVMFIGGPPTTDARTFSYYPPKSAEGTYLGPRVVGSDGLHMSGFSATGEPGTFGFSYGIGGGDRKTGAVGQRINTVTVGRNDPCYCGSSKKYKRCHGR